MSKLLSPIFIILAFLSFLPSAHSQAIAPKSVFLEDLTWTETRDFIDHGGTSILVPTGGTEQSGPHVILGKHNYRVKFVSEMIAREMGDALVAPVIAFVPEGNIEPAEDLMKFAGTISLPEEYFIKLVEYTCRSLKQHGFLDIFLIGDSGGNQNGLKIVSKQLNEEWKDTDYRVHYLSDYYGKPYDAVYDSLSATGLTKDELGAHGGVIDASFLLAVDSSHIRTDQLLNSDWSIEKKAEMGFTGDISHVNVKTGQYMIDKTFQNSIQQIPLLKVNSRK